MMGKRLVMEKIAEIRRLYPFRGYIDDTKEGMLFVGTILADLCPSRGRLLDIGCGGMNKTALFSLLGFEVYGCDEFLDKWHRIEEKLTKLMNFARAMKINVHIQKNGDYSIPWDKGSFDIVTIINVIEHIIESPRNILNIAGEYLKPGGLLLVTIPNSVNLKKRLKVLIGRTNLPSVETFYYCPGKWRGHVREFTLSETAQILRWNGFEIVKQGSFHAWAKKRLPQFPFHQAYKLACIIAPGFRDSVYAVGRKPEGWEPRKFDEEDYRRALLGNMPRGVYDPQGASDRV